MCHHISVKYRDPLRKFYFDASEASGERVDSIGQVDNLQKTGVMYEVGRDVPRGRR
jgi:hypothetical protein